jgi:hypothetical protein
MDRTTTAILRDQESPPKPWIADRTFFKRSPQFKEMALRIALAALATALPSAKAGVDINSIPLAMTPEKTYLLNEFIDPP